jgi:hypothetical protein
MMRSQETEMRTFTTVQLGVLPSRAASEGREYEKLYQ